MFCRFLFKALGTTVAQFVFACCWHFPKMSLIEDIIKLEKKMDTATLAKSIFELVNNEGYTCLLVLFNMMAGYHNQTGKLPDSNLQMFDEIESTAFYLIEMAEDKNLKMDDILNWTTDDGTTLFFQAAFFSESLARELLKKNVVVKTVDNLLDIPSFRVI